MAKVAFAKHAATPEQLLAKLQRSGLIVPNTEHALAYLRYVGGYRLKGYWFHAVDVTSKRFPLGYSFDHIVQRCEFDRELRAASIAAVDRLEVAIRTAMANYLSQAHGPHWFLDTRIFKPTTRWGMGRFIKKIEDEVAVPKASSLLGTIWTTTTSPIYLPVGSSASV